MIFIRIKRLQHYHFFIFKESLHTHKSASILCQHLQDTKTLKITNLASLKYNCYLEEISIYISLFFTQEQIVNSFEGTSIGKIFNKDYGMVCYNKNLIKVYLIRSDGELLLIFSDYLLENILQVEKYTISNDKDGIVVLFESSKIVLVEFDNYLPQILSLKYFEREEFNLRKGDLRFIRVYEDLGMAKISKYCFSMFSLNHSIYKTNVFKFTDIDEKVKNVIDFVFLDNYNTPTICLLYNPKQCSYIHKKDVQAIIFSYDAKKSCFNVMEEFQVPQDTHKILFSKNTLVFISHNDIVFRTSNSCYAVGLNKMSLSQENIICDLLLHNEVSFFEDETLMLLNGDGSMFKITLKFDSKRIIGVSINSLGKYIIPKYISSCKDFVFIGSNECSMLCKKRKDLESDLKGQQIVREPLTDSIEDIEYREIFHSDIGKRNSGVLKLDILHIFYGIVNVNDFFLINKNDLLFTSAGVINSVIRAKKHFDFKDTHSIDVKGKCNKLVLCDNAIFAFGNSITSEFTTDLSTSRKHKIDTHIATLAIEKFNEFIYQISHQKITVYNFNSVVNEFVFKNTIVKVEIYQNESCIIFACLDKENILTIYDHNLSELGEIGNVNAFCLTKNTCLIVAAGSLQAYDILECKYLYFIEDIISFDNVFKKTLNIYNDFQIQSEKLDKVDIFSVELKEINYIFLINKMGECLIYSEIDNFLIKVDTSNRFLQFDSDKNICISKCHDFVFMNTKNPVMITFTKNEIYIYDCSLNIDYIISSEYNYYILMKNRILKCPIIQERLQCIAHTNEIFYNDNCKCFANKNKTIKDSKSKSVHPFLYYNYWILEKYQCLRTPKNILCVGNYYVIASCTREVFKSDANIDQGIAVETSRYFIDLYSKEFIYLTSYELDADEFVFDIKYLSLNDPVGKKGRSDFLVVCTTKIEGEDKQSRGRLIVLELTSIVADVSTPYKDKKLKLFGAENIKGCITGCDEIKGNIGVCLGIKLMVYRIDRSEGLIPIAIHDLYTLSTSISVIKNYLLVSDIYRGLSLFYYQKKPIRLNLLCTSEPIENTMCADFIIKDSEVSFVCADFNGNFVIYTYSPNNILSEGGTKMVKRYSIQTNLGILRKRASFSKLDVLSYISECNYHFSLVGLSTKVYIMLFKLQSQVLQHYKNSFGLNPHNFLNTIEHNAPVSLKKPIYKILIQKFLRFDMNTRLKILEAIDVKENELYCFLKEEFNK